MRHAISTSVAVILTIIDTKIKIRNLNLIEAIVARLEINETLTILCDKVLYYYCTYLIEGKKCYYYYYL